MGKGNFSVVISAVDKASGTIDGINKRLEGFHKQVALARAPFDRLAASYSRFTKLTGIDKIGNGMRAVARAGFSAFQSVSRIVEPLGVIVGAASIAGMYRLATAWANFGTQLGNTANRAGLSAEQLNVLQNAGRLAGVSAEAVSGGMISLRDNMVNATAGKAPQVIGMLQALGFSADDARRFAANTTKALPELADRIAALKDPTLQAEAATTLFGSAGEQLLPFLRRGSAGIAEYTAKAARYGATNTDGVEAANKLREAQTGLTLAVEGLGNSIAQQLAPIIGPLLTQMADWIAANRDWIAQGIGEKVGEFVGWLKSIDWAKVGSDIGSIKDAVVGVADALGGWVHVGEGVLAFFAVTWLAKMLIPILTISKMLLKLPGEAATAATKAGTELDKIGAGPRSPGKAGISLGLNLLGIANDLREGRTAEEQEDFNTNSLLARLGGSLGGMLGMHFDEHGRSEGLFSKWFGGGSGGGAGGGSGGSSGAANFSPRNVAPGIPGEGKPANQAQWNEDLARLQSKGWSREQAAGILGNLDQESGGNEKAKGDGGQARGLGQWHADRQANFAKLYGHDVEHGSHQEQIDFVDWELRNTEKSAGDRLARTTTTEQAASTVRKYYERPADAYGQEDAWRSARANRILANSSAPAPAPSGPDRKLAAAAAPPSGPERTLPAAAGTAASPGQAAPGTDISGQIGVSVRLGNLPPGTTTSTTQSGPALAPLRVERSQVGGLSPAAAGLSF